MRCSKAEGAEKAGHSTGGAGQGAEHENNGNDQHDKADQPQAGGPFHKRPSFLSETGVLQGNCSKKVRCGTRTWEWTAICEG